MLVPPVCVQRWFRGHPNIGQLILILDIFFYFCTFLFLFLDIFLNFGHFFSGILDNTDTPPIIATFLPSGPSWHHSTLPTTKHAPRPHSPHTVTHHSHQPTVQPHSSPHTIQLSTPTTLLQKSLHHYVHPPPPPLAALVHHKMSSPGLVEIYPYLNNSLLGTVDYDGLMFFQNNKYMQWWVRKCIKKYSKTWLACKKCFAFHSRKAMHF